jgi:Uma2 family endonuclease
MADPLAKAPVIPPRIAPTEDVWRAMTPAARHAWLTEEPVVPTVIAPTEDAWRAMTPAARHAWLVQTLETRAVPGSAMTEGRRHKKAKTSAVEALGLHFSAIGRAVYLAEEMEVAYPGAPVFTPDVLAVLGVTEPEDDPRMSWVVADEHKGLDLVLEVLHHGNRKKDLVANVERYAGLGIPEYFVYDRLHQRIHGYRLPDAGARRYQRIVPQLGRHTSAVLGLDLAIQGDRLRFFYGTAELPGTSELLTRLNGMVAGLEARAEEAEAEIQEADTRAQEADARAQEADARAEAALGALREAIAALLGARGIACSDEGRARLASCSNLKTLQGWLLRATSAASEAEVFSS